MKIKNSAYWYDCRSVRNKVGRGHTRGAENDHGAEVGYYDEEGIESAYVHEVCSGDGNSADKVVKGVGDQC